MSQIDAELDALDRLRRLTRRLNLDVATWRLKLALKGGYDPSQPRIPSGQPGGGRWAGGSAGSTGTKPADAERRVSMAVRRISPAAEAECERLNKRDTGVLHGHQESSMPRSSIATICFLFSRKTDPFSPILRE